MSSKQDQRFAGLLLTAMGTSLTIWSWYTALSYGRFSPKLAGVGPIFIVLGLGATLFPTKNILNGSDLEPTKLGWGIAITAMASGGINVLVLESGIVQISE
jgi:hypothetical protein